LRIESVNMSLRKLTKNRGAFEYKLMAMQNLPGLFVGILYTLNGLVLYQYS